ncbi:MAG: hypothetical protein M1826_001806 [Phylliscum demangeonii]|nr:MAG: hypothetical protein M1826_001806 [Phylliscum demangeonii]
MLNPPNPMGHPQPRALVFHDIVYIPPNLVGETLEQIVFNLALITGNCGCDRREHGNSFFDGCRKDISIDWISFAAKGQGVPQGLPAPSPIISPRPGFNPDLNWIPHPHGLGRLNFKGLAAAASNVRRKVWNFGKEEGLMLRGLER